MQLNDQVYNYLLSVSLREPKILKECRDETDIHWQICRLLLNKVNIFPF